MLARELAIFVFFFFGSLLVWALSQGMGVLGVPDLLERVIRFDLNAVLISLGPYLGFQLLRVTISGLSRKV